MPNTHCGKHNKLSKTMGSPLDSMEEIISSPGPLAFSIHSRLHLSMVIVAHDIKILP